mmetsp:Transcript_30452/g.98163  ORF Transcript_30452/g.98163 Transcript_30452/m.98163 type:complete len:233 (+) Transcript_30452:213-911(+)
MGCDLRIAREDLVEEAVGEEEDEAIRGRGDVERPVDVVDPEAEVSAPGFLPSRVEVVDTGDPPPVFFPSAAAGVVDVLRIARPGQSHGELGAVEGRRAAAPQPSIHEARQRRRHVVRVRQAVRSLAEVARVQFRTEDALLREGLAALVEAHRLREPAPRIQPLGVRAHRPGAGLTEEAVDHAVRRTTQQRPHGIHLAQPRGGAHLRHADLVQRHRSRQTHTTTTGRKATHHL